MIIERDLRTWTCDADLPLIDVLAHISAGTRGAVICVERDGRPVGVLTDGDFRRCLVADPRLDVQQAVRHVANLAPRTASADTDPERLAALLDDRITFIPLLDARGRLEAVATTRRDDLTIDGRPIADDQPTFVIAEIGINHNGSPELACELVERAAAAGADAAKFQLRDLATLYREGDRASEDLGAQYTLDLLDRFRLTTEELYVAFDRCREVGIVPLCTAWDEASVLALETYDLPAYKVASADLTNHRLLAALAATRRPLLVSTGMSTEAEIEAAVDLLRREGSPFALLHCNSTYPAPFKDVNLRYLARLREIGGGPVGYSGHERGWHVPVAAVALGARIVEKHLTLDRHMEGNDHKVSLLPNEFARMVDDIRQVEAALGSAAPRQVSAGEAMNRATLAKSLVATRDLAPGDVVRAIDVTVRSPGRGIQPDRLADLLGRTLARTVPAGDFFYGSDLLDTRPTPRPYRFSRPWGLPVRYHDLDAMVELASPDFVEFHLSYQDLELDPGGYLGSPRSGGFTVHSPDLFRGDHILDLASPDDAWWERSIAELGRVLDLTRQLRAWFPEVETPIVICSLGGFSADESLAPSERPARYRRVREAIERLDTTGVELLAQTLPPFPWYLGGQLHCNLFVDPDDTAAFARESGLGLCLDVSHSKLASNRRGASFFELVEELGPHIRHLHLVDARGVDGEGLQIGEGEIDWPVLASQLERLAPGIGFIPEIWLGHANRGEAFWLALDRLERWF